jgi:hypothetical protein
MQVLKRANPAWNMVAIVRTVANFFFYFQAKGSVVKIRLYSIGLSKIKEQKKTNLNY